MKILMTVILALCLVLPAMAIDNPYLGLGFNTVNGEGGWNVRGGTPFTAGEFTGRIDAKLQNTGTELVGDTELEVGIPIGVLQAVIFNVHNFDGQSIAELNRTSDLGLKVRSPETVIGEVVLTFGLGVFGRNGGVYAGPTADTDLMGIGYTQEQIGGLGLETIKRPKDGLATSAENSVNLQLETLLSLGDAYASFLLQPELKGQDNDKVHQALLKVGTNIKVWKVIFNIELDVGAQTWEDSIQTEYAAFGSWNVEF